MPLQHLRSSTANKRPLPAGMSDGQLALNTNNNSPGLFFKDSNGALVKIGPVHVGTTAPNASPASGGQTGNTVGEQWLDTSGSRFVFKVWDGTAWRTQDGEFVNVTGDTMTGTFGIVSGTVGAPGLFLSGDTNTGIYSTGADSIAIATGGSQAVAWNSTGDMTLPGTGALKVQTGTSAQRPGTPATGMVRFNSTIGQFEGYNGTAWSSIGGGATGGNADRVFVENDAVVTADYTIPTGRNAMSAGPITVNAGVTVTVASGSNWVIV